MRHVLCILMLLACQLCAGQEADSTGLPQKPEIVEIQLNGDSLLYQSSYNYSDLRFRFTLTTHNAKHVLLTCYPDVSYPDKTHDGYFIAWQCNDSCIHNDTIVVNGHWFFGEAYVVQVGNDKGWVSSDTIYTDDYLSQELLDFIYGPTEDAEVEEIVASATNDGISIGSLTVRCPAPATLCDLQGRQVRPEHTGIGLLFRVPRHGIYLLRTQKDGRQVARKIAL